MYFQMFLGITRLSEGALASFERASEGLLLGMGPQVVEEILPFGALLGTV